MGWLHRRFPAASPAASPSVPPRPTTLDGSAPLVIGHRGASGYLPEHTLGGYLKAIELGANYIVFEDKLLTQLHNAYGNSAGAPVFIQSLEVNNLQYLNTRTDIKLVQLIDANDVRADGTLDPTAPYGQPYDVVANNGTLTFADMVSGVGLAFVKTYADGIGPWKPYLVKTVDDGVDRNGDGVVTINDRRVDGSTCVIEAAHDAGLVVHAFTFRNDASGYGFSDPQAEMAYYMGIGVDGVFTDSPTPAWRRWRRCPSRPATP